MTLFLRLVALMLALPMVLAPSAEAQILSRFKQAVSRTAQAAGDAARQTLVQEGMEEAGRLMLADGAFAGTASPWISPDGAVALADLPGQAFVSSDHLAFVFCTGADALDAVVFRGRFGAVDGEREMDLSAGDLLALLVTEGRTTPLRVSPRSTLTYGTLTLEPGDDGGLMGSVTLAIGEDAVPRTVMAGLFERTRVVEITGQFRAAPVDAITGISCETRD